MYCWAGPGCGQVVSLCQLASRWLPRLKPHIPCPLDAPLLLLQSTQLEVQTRSVEYSRLFAHPAIGPQVGTQGGPVSPGAASCSMLHHVTSRTCSD